MPHWQAAWTRQALPPQAAASTSACCCGGGRGTPSLPPPPPPLLRWPAGAAGAAGAISSCSRAVASFWLASCWRLNTMMGAGTAGLLPSSTGEAGRAVGDAAAACAATLMPLLGSLPCRLAWLMGCSATARSGGEPPWGPAPTGTGSGAPLGVAAGVAAAAALLLLLPPPPPLLPRSRRPLGGGMPCGIAGNMAAGRP